MSQSKSRSKSKLARARALPWASVMQLGVLAAKRWQRLSSGERKRLLTLLRNSRGRLSNLSVKERAELGKLAGKLDIKEAGRDLLSVIARRGRRSKR
ncbi:MAG: hypothetical protein ACRDK2_10705 [Solirubrobacteraceae bacterium]